MHIVIASDIFGVTPWLLNLVSNWQQQGHEVSVVAALQTAIRF